MVDEQLDWYAQTDSVILSAKLPRGNKADRVAMLEAAIQRQQDRLHAQSGSAGDNERGDSEGDEGDSENDEGEEGEGEGEGCGSADSGNASECDSIGPRLVHRIAGSYNTGLHIPSALRTQSLDAVHYGCV